RRRPFLRKQWLQRLRQSTTNEVAAAAQGYEPPASHVTSSPPSTFPTSTSAAPAIAAISKSAKTPTALIRVGRDHVKSVVHLALSEARVNAFVVISALEGLLSVATEGRRLLGKGITTDPGGTNDNTSNNNAETGGNCTHRNEHGADAHPSERGAQALHQREYKNTPSESGPSALADECGKTGLSQRGCGTDGAAIAVGGSSSNRGESGAALCVRLGALPAVLGFLDEHAGHKQIEPLAIGLLCMFASDHTTARAVRGNADVVATCTARMFPSAAIPVVRDEGSSGTASGARYPSSETRASGEYRRSDAGPERRAGHANDAQSVDCEDPRLNFAAATSPSKLAPPTVSEAAPKEHKPKAAMVATTTAATTTHTGAQSISTITCAHTLSDRATAARGSGTIHTPQGQDKTCGMSAAIGRGPLRPQLPAADLVFVLSVSVQDSPECQRLALRSGGITAMLATLRQLVEEWEAGSPGCGCGGGGNGGGDHGRLSEMCLRVMEHLGRPERGRRRLVADGSVETTIATIGHLMSDVGVLTAATGLLLLLSDSSEGRARILKAGGVSVVFEAMQRLVGNGSLQVKGVEMLQTLIREEPQQARRELDSIKGGWQWLCQGTSDGDALIRYAPGEKHISGWTLSEEERLTTQEALATAEEAASDWTPYSLATFMGTMRSQHKLQIGNLAYYHFFRVVSEAGLLPHHHEDVEDWRDRMRRYEDERHIRVGNITRRRLARDKAGAHARSFGSSSAV
ncbi:unnamed protein product, partial [Pylaiella littoralis]